MGRAAVRLMPPPRARRGVVALCILAVSFGGATAVAGIIGPLSAQPDAVQAVYAGWYSCVLPCPMPFQLPVCGTGAACFSWSQAFNLDVSDPGSKWSFFTAIDGSEFPVGTVVCQDRNLDAMCSRTEGHGPFCVTSDLIWSGDFDRDKPVVVIILGPFGQAPECDQAIPGTAGEVVVSPDNWPP